MTTSRVVLVTGASSGIGLGLAQRYAHSGAHVVLTGRSSSRLAQARGLVPGASTISGNLADPADREQLARRIRSDFGRLDVLVNNAGIQRRTAVADDSAPWAERQEEIDLLLAAPLHLVALLTPLLRSSDSGQIVNVTSGGAFVPQPFAPTYSAAKAALHSYTMNLRYAFGETNVIVTELAPPAVATGLTEQAHGANLDDFCDAVFPELEQRRTQVGFGPTASSEFQTSRRAEAAEFDRSANRFPVVRYRANSSSPHR